VVVGLPDPRLGEIPVAGIVWAAPSDFGALAAWLRDRIGGYKIPRKWFAISAVPLTERGKVDRRQARQIAKDLLAEPEPSAAAHASRDLPA
jgi:acyl-CoA synthetase (AMP-forming)/AMP-acid ligase II